jgi:hypothetical protein
MKNSSFIKAMLGGLLIFAPLLIFSLFFLDPKAGTTVITIFLVSIFFTSVCLVSLIGFATRVYWGNNELLFEAFKTSLRQGTLVGLYALGILGLASLKLLIWWDALLLAFSLILFEIYFKSNKEAKL